MNCEEFRSARLAGEDTEAMRHHLEGCAACRSQVSRLDAGSAALSDASLWEEPSPELAGQVEALITAAGSSDRSGSRRPRFLKVAAAAAAVVIVAAASLALLRPSAPDWEVALPGTDLAPAAIGTVRGWNEAAGTRMVVDVEGLAPAPEGFVYEFWLSDGPLHVSAGTFAGPGRVELWSGVARADFPRLWITLEPLDEDTSPSGQTVLDTKA
jgi:anti-sigma factor RsiW